MLQEGHQLNLPFPSEQGTPAGCPPGWRCADCQAGGSPYALWHDKARSQRSGEGENYVIIGLSHHQFLGEWLEHHSVMRTDDCVTFKHNVLLGPSEGNLLDEEDEHHGWLEAGGITIRYVL